MDIFGNLNYKMAIFLSAGHNSQSVSVKQDPGAINKFGVKEGDLTIEFRDLVCKELSLLGVQYKIDLKEETLQMYLDRIQTGEGSVVIEYHFDAGPEPAEGCTGLVEDDATQNDKDFASELINAAVSILGIKSRGVKPESYTRHGKLALMKETGIICLFEICFLTNVSDMAKYQANKLKLAKEHAKIIAKYENLIS